MAPSDIVKTVQGIYASFGRGDIPKVLSALADDIDWRLVGPPEIPYAKHCHNPAEVGEYFTGLVRNVEVLHFEPREFIADGDTVVVFGSERSRVRATEQTYEVDWVHVFEMRQGRVARFRLYTDTAAITSAYRRA